MKKIVLQLIAFTMLAEEVSVPKIEQDHLLEYYQSHNQVVTLQATIVQYQEQLKEAQKDLQAAVDKMGKDCGDKFAPRLTTPKTIVCVEIPDKK